MSPRRTDVLIIGAGAAGLFCAAQAGQLGLSVLLMDHAPKLAEKIRISGGGRCNFTNREASPAHYLSDNPHFCRSALSRFPPQSFIELVQRHGIAFHEKHKGQLFCDHRAQDIIDMLLAECERGGVNRLQPCAVQSLVPSAEGWQAQTDAGAVLAQQVVVATGGLPVPKIGATAWGLNLAEQWGHRIVAPRPGLVPLTFDATQWAPFAALAGLALPVRISTQTERQTGAGRKARATEVSFLEDLLFTHRGLSGPAVLQISSYWRQGQALEVNLLPDLDLRAHLAGLKSRSRRQLGNELAGLLPHRLATTWLEHLGLDAGMAMPQVPDAQLQRLADSLQRWQLEPVGDEGWAKAEVMIGGIDTRDLNSQTMASRIHPQLYFIGEVVDVTGWLGGYNFQWAWASAHACAQALAAARQ